jgi:D-alanine-D-alanine ligase
MHRIRVGVLRGGPSDEYEVSLKTGATILNNLPAEKYAPKEIFIDKNGNWHVEGRPVQPSDALTHIDVVVNALHGHYGEDGKVQHILESLGIPFTGSGSFASAVGMNKLISKDIFRNNKIKTPQHKVIESRDGLTNELILEIFKSFPLPVIVKPSASGSSVGVTLVKDFKSFESAILKAFEHGNIVMIEEYIPGIEATVGVINDFRDHELYALPPVEIRPRQEFFDYDAKYSDGESGAIEIVPGNFTFEQKVELEDLARRVHQVLGLDHYSRTDFIVSPRRGIYVLEANTLPGLTPTSLMPKSMNAVGVTLPHFLDHIVQLAMRKK